MRWLIPLFRRKSMSRPVRRIRITAWGVEHEVRQHGRDDMRLLAGVLEGPRC